jgi:hypothetical protein
MVLDPKPVYRSRLTWLSVMVGVSIAATALIRVAIDQVERYRQYSGSSFDFTSTLWRWFLAMGIFVVIGFVYGLVLRTDVSLSRFDWRRALALGAVPLALALTWPAFTLQWPTATWLRGFRIDFTDPMPAAVMSVLAGFAIASGFRERRDA